MSVRPALSVAEFFHEVLTAALRSQAVATTEMTEFYLINLLAEFAHAEIDEEPLGLKLTQALAEPPEEHARGLREVGDTALYVSGFFGESLERRLLIVEADHSIQSTAAGGAPALRVRGAVSRRAFRRSRGGSGGAGRRRDGGGRRGLARLRLGRGGRCDHHHHATPVHRRHLLGLADVGGVLGHALEHRAPRLWMHDLAAAELHDQAYLVAFEEEATDVRELEIVVVDARLGSQLVLLDRDQGLAPLRLPRLLGLLELELPEVHDATDGRDRPRRDLHEV